MLAQSQIRRLDQRAQMQLLLIRALQGSIRKRNVSKLSCPYSLTLNVLLIAQKQTYADIEAENHKL
jgi:hypothetical protein